MPEHTKENAHRVTSEGATSAKGPRAAHRETSERENSELG